LKERQTVERKKRILMIDDEPAFTRLMKLNIESNGAYEVQVENNGKRAVAAARAYRPDIIFLDVIMPDIDGGQIAGELRSDPGLKKVPIVFLTAVVSKNEVIERGDMIGGQMFLAKPVSVADVLSTIEKLAA
jgi:two-component system OmpR family response regulator